VLARLLRGRREREQLILGHSGARQRDDLGHPRRPGREGAGLIEGDLRDGPQLLHDDGTLDQDAVPAGVRDRREQRRHGGEHHRARTGDDHVGHGAEQRRAQAAAERQRDEEDGQGREHDADGVALLDLLDEQLGPRLGRAGLLDQRHDPGHDGVGCRAGHPDPQRAFPVQRPGENLVPDGAIDRHRLAGDAGLVHLTGAEDHHAVGADALTGAYDEDLADGELGGVHLPLGAVLGAVLVEQGGPLGGHVEQRAHRVLRPLGRVRLLRARRGKDDDQQPPVEDLPDAGRANGSDDHEQVDVEGPLPQRLQPGQQRLPATRGVAGQERRVAAPGGRAGGIPEQHPEQEQHQADGRPPHLGQRPDAPHPGGLTRDVLAARVERARDRAGCPGCPGRRRGHRPILGSLARW